MTHDPDQEPSPGRGDAPFPDAKRVPGREPQMSRRALPVSVFLGALLAVLALFVVIGLIVL